MTDTDPTAKPSSVAGGAHYHILRATKKWSEFAAAEDRSPSHTVQYRERRDEERRDEDKSARAGTTTGR